jgi:hypothetical protein
MPDYRLVPLHRDAYEAAYLIWSPETTDTDGYETDLTCTEVCETPDEPVKCANTPARAVLDLHREKWTGASLCEHHIHLATPHPDD